MQDYELASASYAKLVRLFPHISEYRTYHSQSLLKAGEVEDAKRSQAQIGVKYNSNQQQQQQLTQRELMLQVSIQFEEGDLNGCKAILDQCVEEDPETMIAQATLCTKERRYYDAIELYSEAFNIEGFDAEIAYNIALCHYMLGEYEDALEVIKEIINRATESHPEFALNTIDDEDENIDVSNSTYLQESYLIETCNLKAAIEYDKNEITKARTTLKQMPQRVEEELDPVTLHNQGLMNIELDVNSGFEKLKFLLANPPFPPETFGNLLLLYCKYGHHDLSAEILAENSHLTYDFLTEDLYDYLDIVIMASASPDEALIKFEGLTKNYAAELRKLAKELESEETSQNSQSKQSRISIEKLKSFYIPILMAQSYIYWQREEYAMIEQLFRKSADLCVDVDAWRLNIAHTFFIQQGSKFKDAIKYYETFVKEKSSESILDIAPIILANLCVSYIMTNQNEEAEDIMKLIDKEEEERDESTGCDTGRKYHSCIVNLVIGTLYCEKGNFEFGISRICKSLEPLEEKLGADTWFYTKRCLLALVDQMAKQMLLLKRDSFDKIAEFLDLVDRNGGNVDSVFGEEAKSIHKTIGSGGTSTISSEARQLKNILSKLME